MGESPGMQPTSADYAWAAAQDAERKAGDLAARVANLEQLVELMSARLDRAGVLR